MDNDTEGEGEGVNAALAQAAAEAEERAQRAEETAAHIAEAARETEMVRTVETRLGEMEQWRAEHEARTQASIQAAMAEARSQSEAAIQSLMERLTPPPPPPEPVIVTPPPPEPSRSEPGSEAVDPAADGPRESPEAPENPVAEVARKLKKSL